MTDKTEIEPLPLPEPEFMSGDCTVGESAFTDEQMTAYARANVAHATAARDAENQRLAAALEAAREDAGRWRERYVAQLACYRQDLHGDMANDAIERAEKAAERIAAIDQVRREAGK